MADTNGISDQFLKSALAEVEMALKNKKLSSVDRVGLATNKLVIEFIRDERGEIKKMKDDIKNIRDNSVLLWVKNNKVTAGLLFTALAIVNSYWNWAGLRKEWLVPLLNALGIPAVNVP